MNKHYYDLCLHNIFMIASEIPCAPLARRAKPAADPIGATLNIHVCIFKVSRLVSSFTEKGTCLVRIRYLSGADLVADSW